MVNVMQKELVDAIKELSAEMHDDLIRFAQKLIQIPSISGNEKALSELNISQMKRLNYDKIFRDDFGNVIGIVNGTEPGPTIMYNSHMDHVSPGEETNWEGYHPYGGIIDICEVDNQDKETEKAECIHGRGASDVKGGEATQIFAGGMLVRLRDMGFSFRGSFMFTGVVLEEAAEMVGMLHLIDKTFPEKGLSYDAMVTSEATSLKLYCGHRGRVELLITVYGRTSHGSAPWLGINAIYKAMKLIDNINEQIAPYLPEDTELGKGSVSVNVIECSPGSLSIVPDKCMISLDRRLIPGETPEIALAQIQELIHKLSENDKEFKADVVIRKEKETSYTAMSYQVSKTMEPWKISQDHGFVKAAASALTKMGQEVKYGYWNFGTDASKTCGIDRKPTIGYSPMQEQYAHTPNDKCRTDYMKAALEGNVAIFLNAVGQNEESFAKVIL